MHVSRLRRCLLLACFPLFLPAHALDKPTGEPLVLSPIETEQSVPLAILSPDGKTASCTTIRMHWNPTASLKSGDEATSFELDLPADNPSASIFAAQLWNASLASSLAWQQPWQGARWKVFQVPACNGTGIDAALAVGMIATSARRPYPKETAVLGNLHPDGSLGSVTRLLARMDAAAAAGIIRLIIPNVQRFDTNADGEVVDVMRHASDLHLECVPVDNLVDATQVVMNDPLPDITPATDTPRYSHEVANYIDTFARQQQTEVTSGLQFAPPEVQLAKYPPRQATLWKSIYADYASAQQAYRAGQIFVAYQLFARVNGRMHGLNALSGNSRATFDVKAALARADDLRDRLHALMNPPTIDRGELESAVLVAQMADWAYDINASLEGAQLVTKQAFSVRSDATESEKDRAREAILFALEESSYLLNEADFYTGLLPHIGNNNPLPADVNASHLLPQLIPAQLATAQLFIEGIRPRAGDLRDGLLFDPRLVAYVNVLRETKADWDARQHKKVLEAQINGNDTLALETAPPPTSVSFDPGNTYLPPKNQLTPTTGARKLSEVALCLIWANMDCEIAMLDEKYLRLGGTIEAATREWRLKDRSKLDALLQAAELGARQGIAFAEKAQLDPSVLEMIYEKATRERLNGDDATALDALRNYWRCALLGNMCWQLAHTRKAEAVDLSAVNDDASKEDKKGDTKKTGTDEEGQKPETTASEAKPPGKNGEAPRRPIPAEPLVHDEPARTEPPTPEVAAPAPPSTNGVTETEAPRRALPVIAEDIPATAPPSPSPGPVSPSPVVLPPPPAVSPAATNGEPTIPVAPVARPEDVTGNPGPATNAAPVIGPEPPGGFNPANP